jgi:hypothetical protein
MRGLDPRVRSRHVSVIRQGADGFQRVIRTDPLLQTDTGEQTPAVMTDFYAAFTGPRDPIERLCGMLLQAFYSIPLRA